MAAACLTAPAPATTPPLPSPPPPCPLMLFVFPFEPPDGRSVAAHRRGADRPPPPLPPPTRPVGRVGGIGDGGGGGGGASPRVGLRLPFPTVGRWHAAVAAGRTGTPEGGVPGGGGRGGGDGSGGGDTWGMLGCTPPHSLADGWWGDGGGAVVDGRSLVRLRGEGGAGGPRGWTAGVKWGGGEPGMGARGGGVGGAKELG